ncbi:hypothetical protein F4825DRAFT_432408 [Nemania diffusa]|nr:hypothetical protein F4825DRAFT_432408 [Nemania diffusa]
MSWPLRGISTVYLGISLVLIGNKTLRLGCFVSLLLFMAPCLLRPKREYHERWLQVCYYARSESRACYMEY